jgi:2',3'-cyclic-nucleotide 2'-phosphodiesterase (5'-nucleotidase family)
MNKTHFIAASAIALSIISSCGTSKKNTIRLAYKDYDIGKTYVPDTGIQSLLLPYKDSVDKAMGKVIGFAPVALKKKPMESELGNFMADCMRMMAARKFNRAVDAAFVNYGGIRSDLPQGQLTLGNIYELMPFDNLIVLQQVKGSVLHRFLDHVASKGGWPASGITMGIQQKQAVHIMVSGKPLDETAVYIIANSDYVANGGDDCDMLKAVPQINMGYLYRDALINYIQELAAQNKPVQSALENRVTNVN